MSKNRNEDVERFAEIFKALSCPQRLRIFLRLMQSCVAAGGCGPGHGGMSRCVSSLGGDLGLAASTVSHHLKELRRAGLMQVQRRGQKVECWVSEDTLRLLAAFFCGPGNGAAVCGTPSAMKGASHGRRKK